MLHHYQDPKGTNITPYGALESSGDLVKVYDHLLPTTRLSLMIHTFKQSGFVINRSLGPDNSWERFTWRRAFSALSDDRNERLCRFVRGYAGFGLHCGWFLISTALPMASSASAQCCGETPTSWFLF